MISTYLHDVPRRWLWTQLAGLAWIAIAMVSTVAAVGFLVLIITAPASVVIWLFGIAIPMRLLGMIWGDRDPLGAGLAALYGLGLFAAGLAFGGPVVLLWPLGVAGGLSFMAARELNE